MLIFIIIIIIILSYKRAIRLFVTSVVDGVGYSALDRFGKLLLDLLGHDGGFAVVLCVGLVG
jgi:hypothetical protein